MVTKTIMCRIEEVGNEYISALCIIGGTKGQKKVKRFEKKLLENAVRLEPGVYFEIETRTNFDEETHQYRETDEHRHLFEIEPKKDFFSKFRGSSFFPDSGRPGEPENSALRRDH